MLLIGRERGKGQIGKIPGPSPSKSGKSPSRSGKSQEGQKRTKKEGRVQNRETPPFETPPVWRPLKLRTFRVNFVLQRCHPNNQEIEAHRKLAMTMIEKRKEMELETLSASLPRPLHKVGNAITIQVGASTTSMARQSQSLITLSRGSQGKKKSIHHHRGTPLSLSVVRPRGHRAKKATVYTIFVGKQGTRVYTIGPYTIKASDLKKKK